MTMPWRGQKLLGCNVDPDRCYWISNDALCRRWSWWELVKHSNCTKVVRDSWLKYEDELDGFLYFSPRPTSEGVINSADKGLAYCSSVPSAIDLAIQMGCTSIVLLGVDNGFRSGYTHFWQFWDKKDHPVASRPAQGPLEQQEKVFKINEMAYEALHHFAREKGVGIVNCSLLTRLREFAYVEFHAFMSGLHKGENPYIGVL